MAAEILHIRATPHATESRTVEKALREQKVRETAYRLHECRYIKAKDDPYEAEILDRTPAHVLADRNWQIANSLIDSQPAMEALDQQHRSLLERSAGRPVEVFKAPYVTKQSRSA